MRGQGDDVRTLMKEAERAAALIYTHFKKEFGGVSKSDDRLMFLGHDQSMKN
jgi:hypothetical protein